MGSMSNQGDTPRNSTGWDQHRLVTRRELARYLKLSPRSIERMDSEGSGPPRIHLGRRAIRYDLRDVDLWLEARGRNSRQS